MGSRQDAAAILKGKDMPDSAVNRALDDAMRNGRVELDRFGVVVTWKRGDFCVLAKAA